MNTIKQKMTDFAIGAVAMIAFAWGFGFVVLNWLMNCQSWDEAYWTAASSCVRPGEFTMQLIDGFRALL